MAAPPPQGFSPWSEDVPVTGSRAGRAPWPTPWLWLPAALSSMVLVLLVVVVNRQQAQARRIGELLDRVQTLEHSRALERTAVLEQQLRSMLSRLQALEKGEQQRQGQGRQLQSLEAELQLLRRMAGRTVSPLAEPPTGLPEPLRPSRPQRPSPEMPLSP